jgi:type I restriction enzyme, R subunit
LASNFEFLKHEKQQFFDSASNAEALALSKPRGACFYARYTLEMAVQWLYANDASLRLPYDPHKLGALVHEPTFKQNMSSGVWNKVRVILKVGNQAVHKPQQLTARDGEQVVKSLFHVLYWVSRVYASDLDGHPEASFDRKLLPVDDTGEADASMEQLQELEEKFDLSSEMLQIKETRLAQAEDEITTLQAQVAQLKAQNQAEPDRHDYNEAETRKYLIDLLLREAGWPIHRVGWTEFEVQGMPLSDGQSRTGKGFVDYVLWDDNGLPLGLVEAKRSMLSAKKGQQQAKLYADCLEQQFGQRPVIFGSNGYDHWIWDDVRYPPRPIEGFYKKDELRLVVHRRKNAVPLHTLSVDPDIAGRPYQIQAIRHLTETFGKKVRKGLFVMATGTGKTRTTIALVDLMKRADWVKRVLFLADRNALVTQAKRAFTELLPTVTVADITKDKNADATVIMSTYPTMINRVNDLEAGERRFGPGHFDLIVVDEAHRSIYKKYASLFDYFDGLLLGLTATPRDEVHRDTYKIFDLEPGVPTYAYELDDAVEQGFLCPPKGVSVEFKFLQKGVKYNDLPKSEREHYEEIFEDPESGDVPPHISKSALNVWLFNEDTVDKALKLLMEKGLKTHEGDRLGKTIIFARNQKHAEFVADRFDIQFPHLKGHFCRVIHSDIDYPQSLLDEFSVFENDPVIAVSVDMLDTGIDIPELLNLVFFKPVRTGVKFIQMIGRGTRLCEDLFGTGLHKTEFLVFDLCDNFAYFEQNVPDREGSLPESLTSRLIGHRLSLLVAIRSHIQEPDEATAEIVSSAADLLHGHVAGMNLENFLVRKHFSPRKPARPTLRTQNSCRQTDGGRLAGHQPLVNAAYPRPSARMMMERPVSLNFHSATCGLMSIFSTRPCLRRSSRPAMSISLSKWPMLQTMALCFIRRMSAAEMTPKLPVEVTNTSNFSTVSSRRTTSRPCMQACSAQMGSTSVEDRS